MQISIQNSNSSTKKRKPRATLEMSGTLRKSLLVRSSASPLRSWTEGWHPLQLFKCSLTTTRARSTTRVRTRRRSRSQGQLNPHLISLPLILQYSQAMLGAHYLTSHRRLVVLSVLIELVVLRMLIKLMLGVLIGLVVPSVLIRLAQLLLRMLTGLLIVQVLKACWT